MAITDKWPFLVKSLSNPAVAMGRGFSPGGRLRHNIRSQRVWSPRGLLWFVSGGANHTMVLNHL